MPMEVYHSNGTRDVVIVGLVVIAVLVVVYYLFVKPHVTTIERDSEGRITSIITA